MKKHIHAIKGLASGCFGLSEQSGFLWLIDNICHYKLRMEQRCIFDDGIVDIRNHAYRGCIDQQITLCNGISQCTEHSNWESATITTLDDKIPQYIQKICKRDPFSGHTVTGGIVTVKDSNWLLSWTLNRQQQFRDQPKNQLCVWVYGLFSDKPGNYVKKAMRDCTGKELCMEWLYHIGVPEDQIEELAEHSANTIPVMMPYIDAFFMPRAMGDRPDIVPEGAVNFAFLGQFAETGRDTIFTTEYSMRTGMEAVYTLLDIDRGVPEVWGSTYDVRALIDATVKLRDGKKITDMDLPLIPRLAMKEALKKIEGTDLEKFLKEYNAI